MSFLPTPDDGCRRCSFDCVYCPYTAPGPGGHWPSPGEIGSAVSHGLSCAGEIDSITVSGPGEPTLHPHFGLALANVLAARQLRPAIPVRVATNGSTLMRPSVRRNLDFADERIVRLDAAPERVMRPAEHTPLGSLVAALGTLRDFSIEATFFAGHHQGPIGEVGPLGDFGSGPALGNADDGSVREWLALLAELRPRAIYIGTVPEPGAAGTRPVSHPILAAIASRASAETGAPVYIVS